MFEITTQYLIGQGLSFVALILMFCAMQQNKKESLLLFYTIANVFYATSLLFMFSISGCISITLSIIICLTFYIYAKKQLSPNKWILIIFIVLLTANVVIFWEGWYDLLMLIGIIVGTIGDWQDNPFWIRVLSGFQALMMLIFNLIIFAYINAIMESMIIVSSVIAIIRYDYKHAHNKPHILILQKKI